MEFIDQQLLEYCLNQSNNEPEVLQKLSRYTHANVLQPRMLSGHLQGRLLSFISHLVQPKNILEIGTYTGYSAICLAEGLAENGKLITIDVNPELEDVIRKFVEDAGMSDKIKFIVGDAYQVIRTLPQTFDLVFIDADKQNYKNYYDLVIDKLNPGGVIIADNVLWSGKVIDEKSLAKDKDTQLLHEFNCYIKQDSRVSNLLLPVRDGLMLVRKR